MSSYNFWATLHADETHPVYALLRSFQKLRDVTISDEEYEGALCSLRNVSVDEEMISVMKKTKLGLSKKEDCLSVNMDVGSSVGFDFFSKLIELIDATGVERYHASLFDSSSGGRQVWDKSEAEITLEESQVFLLGEFDEEDGLAEALEEQGAVIVEDLEGSNLVVLGQNADGNLLQLARQKNLMIVAEEEIWDYMF